MAEAVQIKTTVKKVREQTAEICFPRRTLARIDALAKRTSLSRNFLINQAVEHSLEDLEDIYLAEQVLEEIKTRKQKNIPASELYKELGLEN
ncbi:hypothetical protein V1L52_04275 [Treponema sp. HNW]|uniref:type II toxin-antitoxin system RelB family antitoxin n=1 Tax=Treponema sp. HNW TaxID=3116654 RepID=UPI003D14E6F6